MDTQILGFELKEKIYSSNRTKVYRAIRESDQLPVILKVPVSETPTLQEYSHYQNEIKMLSHLDLKGVIKIISLEVYKKTFAIVEKDIGGESLEGILGDKPLDVSRFLMVAIKVAEGLGNLHENGIIHKDINPSNIIFNEETGELEITDFGISTMLSRETQEIKNPEFLEGTIAYMSPEQTGRVNRAIDYRTDFYSLGASYYEILTGQAPFVKKSARELVSLHISERPKNPVEILPTVPPVIGKIILKLLEKNPDDRYQSTTGLKFDLTRCLEEYAQSGIISDFSIGTKDISSKFTISQKLYGRDKEIETLLKGYDRVCNGFSAVILVAGHSGIGKSVLVKEIYKSVSESNGYFISGKFDQFRHDIPYASLSQAFKDLVLQLLSEHQDLLDTWKQKIAHALGRNAQVIVDILPELELIIGKQQPVPELAPAENQNRLNIVFNKFVRVFAKEEHPLVIFLDDLQWSDLPTLDLILNLMTNHENHHILIVGTYRSNEVSISHPLMIKIDSMINLGASVRTIDLAELSKTDVRQLVSDTLHTDGEEIDRLADLLMTKTHGNPFFITQLFKSLYQDHLISFDFTSGRWVWNFEEIAKVDITENVVQLMTDEIKKLGPNSQAVLKIAACIGNTFEIEDLSSIYGKPKTDSIMDLWEPLKDGLIILGGGYYRFLHDRVHQAVYELVGDKCFEIHLMIARLKSKEFRNTQCEDLLFDIVSHYNKAIELIKTSDEKKVVANFNIMAGIKAKHSGAYQPAVSYLEYAAKLLPADIWQNDYSLGFSQGSEHLECSYLSGNFEEGESLFFQLIEQASSDLDKAKLASLRLQAYTQLAKYEECIDIGIGILNELGMKLKKNPSPIPVLQELLNVKIILAGKKASDLLELPEMTNPTKKMILKIMIQMCPGAYLSTQENMLPLLILKSVALSARHGNIAETTYAYSGYGLILAGVLKSYQEAYEFGNMALTLNEKLRDISYLSSTCMVYASFTVHWVKHLRELLPIFDRGYEAGIESGDLAYAGYCLNRKSWAMLCKGDSLAEVLEITHKQVDFMEKSQDTNFLDDGVIKIQFCKALMGKTSDLTSLSDEGFDETDIERFTTLVNCDFHILKGLLFFLFGTPDRGIDHSGQAGSQSDAMIALDVVSLHNFLHGLLAAQMYDSCDSSLEKMKYRWILNSSIKKISGYSKACSENQKHRLSILQAEKARISHQFRVAETLYEQAIDEALEQGFIHNAAISCELAGKYYKVSGRKRISAIFIKESQYLYGKWGATAKVEHLNQTYSDILSHSPTTLSNTAMPSLKDTNAIEASSIDMSTIVDASRALSQEFVLHNLIRKVMKIVQENAGAEKAMLLLSGSDNKELFVEAKYQNNEDLKILDSQPLDQSKDLAQAIVQYVARCRETLILSNATKEGRFVNDSYLQEHQTKSVFCIPIVNQGNLIGILYLENNLMADAFTDSRVETLSLICSQIAISIENTRLYNDLEERIKARTEEVLEKSRDIRSILENIDQGILTFGRDLMINNEYSKYLESIFPGSEIVSRNVLDLLFKDSTVSDDIISQTKSAIKGTIGSDLFAFDINSHILPRKIIKNVNDITEILELDWRPITNKHDCIEKIMLVIRDITEIQVLKEKAKDQSEELEIIGQILNLKAERFDSFCENSSRIVDECRSDVISKSTPDHQLVESVLRSIHTIKGNARMLNLSHISETIHVVEEHYQSSKKKALSMLLSDLELVDNWIQNYRRIAKEKIAVFRKEAPGDQLAALIDEEVRKLSASFNSIESKAQAFERISSLRQEQLGQSFKSKLIDMISSLPDIAKELAKEPPSVNLDIDENIMLDSQSQNLLADVMMHCFRNSLDHGIETKDERRAQGKCPQGSIEIKVSNKSDCIEITFQDDGRGLHLGQLRKTGERVGLNASDLADEDIAALIFRSGISTAKQITNISGRGVGLDAVKHFLVSNHGDINICFTDDEVASGFRSFKFVIHLPKTFGKKISLPSTA
ncbi:AAA family ATPase [Pseudobacteriovorax antillogorgiicola]|uniref:histidine kinase n=1 Tax=Pseudobacteriovorax antillogorgiicola TaxID=1513793 RepID=A0A1Y6BTD7_9BACT|nr:AAA family ATPase [Pseudobacteriovorax antillogorgiicola]TCS54627.1 putative ATPase [Pseudobacteriovorax antillogorgiicola]SMF17223.1 Predicted ATPase [Pseudobacteriovorax antillogorgiicola]